ncbi:hypothetical protein [Franconibacter helveticus]|uniref:hypothetical protein n=1 Tax=Franconibacter helveticus TaxID=357240 RepID=UPI002910A212|nr:hypothetical protein [Franconibacter helveticus]MDU6925401.1 hypothetical protein [Franconibacter helveticus]
MQANHDYEEGCVFISMTMDEASVCYDALGEAIRRFNGEGYQRLKDALIDLLCCANIE